MSESDPSAPSSTPAPITTFATTTQHTSSPAAPSVVPTMPSSSSTTPPPPQPVPVPASASAPAVPPAASSGADDADGDDTLMQFHQSDFNCSLCLSILYDPITLTCGHSYCRACVWETRNRGTSQCGLCRTPFGSIDPLTVSTNHLLHSLIQQARPKLFKARRAEARVMKQSQRQRLGIFLSLMPHFPGATTQLHIYEQRYRYMVHAAETSTRQFIIVRARGRSRADALPPLPPQPQPPQPAVGAPIALNDLLGNNNDAPEGMPRPVEDHDIGPHVPPAVRRPPHGIQPAALAGMGPRNNLNPPPGWPDVAEGDVGCIVRITSVQWSPDGRALITIQGQQRVRLTTITHESDHAPGLFMADCIPIVDTPLGGAGHAEGDDDEDDVKVENKTERKRAVPSSTTSTPSSHESKDAIPPNSAEAAAATQAELEAKARVELAGQIRSLLDIFITRANTSMQRLENIHGAIPSDAADLSFWICRALPDEFDLKEDVLGSTSVTERLELCVVMIGRCIETVRRNQQYTSWTVAAILFAIVVYLIYFR